MIAIVDYRAGNLVSVRKAFACFSGKCVVSADPETVRTADKIVIPGVGHFSATAELQDNGMAEVIRESIQRGAPVIGICLGLQWLFSGSEEAGDHSGLGLFSGLCTAFPGTVKSPHVGWNQIRITTRTTLLRRVLDGSYFYFTHSFRAPENLATTAVCQYGGPFPAVIERENVFGVQFHPEKSGAAGLQVVENFCAL